MDEARLHLVDAVYERFVLIFGHDDCKYFAHNLLSACFWINLSKSSFVKKISFTSIGTVFLCIMQRSDSPNIASTVLIFILMFPDFI